MKKIWLVLLIIVGLLIGLYFIIKSSQTKSVKQFKIVQLDTTNLIVNNMDEKYIDTIINVGLNKLGISGVIVLVNPLPPEVKAKFSSELELKAHIREHQGFYYIWIDKLSKDETIDVLSHELIHLLQYHTKRLVVNGNTPIWEGNVYELNNVPYHSRPWESEAFDNSNDLKYKILETLY